MTGPAYAAARIAAVRVLPYFEAVQKREPDVVQPDLADIETLIDTTFWASLRREEGYSPRISMAFVKPDSTSLMFEWPLPLSAEALVRLAPAADRPGIHLGIWRNNGELYVWGATRRVPPFCFVLEIVAPGLLVVKHGRRDSTAKFVNVAVLEGDQIKVVDLRAASLPDCPDVVSSLLGRAGAAPEGEAVNVLVELAVSMRAHGRGGALLVVPAASDSWRESIVQPIQYSISPPFSKLGALMREDAAGRDELAWQDRLRRTVETIAGLTSVDGATVINDRSEVLAFGVKIRRRKRWPQVEEVVLSEPIQGAEVRTVPTVQIGGTRHLSAAQFGHDQRDAVALVASQDGRFTIFGWSDCDRMVHAHRVEALLV